MSRLYDALLWVGVFVALVFLLSIVAALITGPTTATTPQPTAPHPHITSLEGGATVPTDTYVTFAAPIVSNPVGSPKPSARATSTPRTHSVGSPLLAGFATWYANGPGIFGAAGPDLRRVLGDWRGSYVVVTGFTNGQAHSATVLLSDWCLCSGAHQPRLVDLSVTAFERVCGSLSLGVCRVEVQWP